MIIQTDQGYEVLLPSGKITVALADIELLIAPATQSQLQKVVRKAKGDWHEVACSDKQPGIDEAICPGMDYVDVQRMRECGTVSTVRVFQVFTAQRAAPKFNVCRGQKTVIWRLSIGDFSGCSMRRFAEKYRRVLQGGEVVAIGGEG